MRHTALWSCTHISNIIDLSGKTKKLWSGQASLRGAEAEEEVEEQIRLKQCVSLRSKGRHNNNVSCEGIDHLSYVTLFQKTVYDSMPLNYIMFQNSM